MKSYNFFLYSEKRAKNGFLNELRFKRDTFKNHVLNQYKILVALYFSPSKKKINFYIKSHKFDIMETTTAPPAATQKSKVFH